MIALLTQLFPLWAVLLSVGAVVAPGPFAALGAGIVPLLMLVMLAMGLTLRPADFAIVLARPWVLALGTALQFTIMPLAALLVATLLELPPEWRLGMVLVGASSGGTASNVITYLAGGNVALSVALTACSTLLAVVLMPLITLWLAGQHVNVPTMEMLAAVAQVAVGPVIVGMIVRGLFPRPVQRLQPLLPLASTAAICVIIAIIVALNREHVAAAGTLLMLAVMLHNALGLGAGYALARAARLSRVDARTIAIEVGMQNSGLAVALALKFFAPAAALPGALFSVWHNISGSLLASWWSRRTHAQRSVTRAGFL